MGGMFGAIGALGALIQRGTPAAGRRCRARCSRTTCSWSAQHMMQFAMTGKPAAPMPSAHQPLGDLRRVHRQGRRADLPRRGQRHAVGDLLRRVRLRRPEGRPAPGHQQRPRARARLDCCRCCASASRRAARAELAAIVRGARPALRADHAARRTCSTTRTCAPPAAWPTCVLPDGDKAGQTVKTTLFPITLDGERLRRAAATRRGSASTPTRCCSASAIAPRRDRRARSSTRGGLTTLAMNQPETTR